MGSEPHHLSDRLRDRFGGIWTNVAFHYEAIDRSVVRGSETRLCEAVAHSFSQPLVLLAEEIRCPGARRALGLDDDDDALVEQMTAKTSMNRGTLQKILGATPCLSAPPSAVGLGKDLEEPGVVVGYVRAEEAMRMLRQWQVIFEKAPVVALSTFLAICAWVVVRAYKHDAICVSFGCFDSRLFGGVEYDTMVVGMPSSRARQLLAP